MRKTGARRAPGRPRSQEVDSAILSAALDLMIERGAGRTSIEQVAQRAGVTRATVYRRFPDKTTLLIQAIEAEHRDHDPGAPDWPDLSLMVHDMASYLSRPRHRRMLRRLYGAVDDHPELLRSYRDSQGGRRASAELATLARARDEGRLPPDTNPEILQQILNGAILHHLGAYPDTVTAADISAFFIAVLKQTGYDPGRQRAAR